MSWSREEALTDPAIREPLIFLSEFRFSYGIFPPKSLFASIARFIRPKSSSDEVMRFPSAEGCTRQQPRTTKDMKGEVLHAAVDQLLSIYNAARAQGLKPDASWLKPNPNFS